MSGSASPKKSQLTHTSPGTHVSRSHGKPSPTGSLGVPPSPAAGAPASPGRPAIGRPPEPAMPAGSSVFAVFDGRTPCHEVVLEFTNTGSFPGCLKIKWRLTLYQDIATGEPGTYLFMGTSQFREGSWRIMNGMDGDPDAIIYQLYPEDAQEPFSLLKVDENHLYLMDRDLNLLVGNELFSYTLSRVESDTQ